jgi:two-component system, NarL family, response regulator DegU
MSHIAIREICLRTLRRIYRTNNRLALEWLQPFPRLLALEELSMNCPSGAGREIIRVLLADSNQTQSQLLGSALRRQPGLRVTYCRGELSETLRALREVPVNIVLLGDWPTDHEALIQSLRTLRANHSNVGVVLLLDNYDRNLVVNALRAGARGLFCRAHQPFRALCRCISVVHQGQYWANTEQMGYVIDALSSPSSVRVLNAKGEGLLTPREEQVVNLVAEGSGNREIAQQLGIRENTVKKSLLRIYDKLGVSNRVELVLYALAHRGTKRASTPTREDATGNFMPSTKGLEVGRVNLGEVDSRLHLEDELHHELLPSLQRIGVRDSASRHLLED